ncbi:hypothetical protein [Bacteroides sp.]|uniref:hypothetical protein n=1 Tax=Bacteroides sp. TaxID=29523 RepID=UPI0025C37DC4|nr:hypothetical protein [Bacteroides sp.]
MQKTEKTIRGVGKLHIQRSERFPLKKAVSNFIENLIELSAKNAKKHISLAEYATFCYGELQMHSIIAPAIAKLTNCFIMEYPIRRGISDNSGRVDYYCINEVGTAKEYNLFLELKCGRQGIPNENFRKKNIELWHEANKQLEGISQEIQQNKDFYGKTVMRVCMEVIVLYADTSKGEQIKSNILQDALNISVDTLAPLGFVPNLNVLWEFHPDIVEKAVDEFNNSRQFWGLLFLCRVMRPILPE